MELPHFSRTHAGLTPAGGDPGSRRPKVLVVCSDFTYPPTNGYLLRIWALIRSLGDSGYDIQVLSLGGNSDARVCRKELSPGRLEVEFVRHGRVSLSRKIDFWRRAVAMLSPLPYGVRCSRSAAMKRVVQRMLDSGVITAAVCEETYLLTNFPAARRVPLILDHHNAEHVLIRRYARHAGDPVRKLYALVEGWKLRRWERRSSSRSDALLVCSDDDRRAFGKLCPGVPAIVTPNAIDVDTYPVDPGGEPGTMVYMGGMDWLPNRDAVEHFAFRILPELRRVISGPVRLVVAGRGPATEFRRKLAPVSEVEFTGAVPDIRPVVARAAVCVVPLRIGSGTRLKILEAAAMGKAIVSTTVGAEGLRFVDGREILLADEPAKFAGAIALLLGNSAMREALGLAARRRVEREYGLHTVREALAEALASARPPLMAGT